MWTLGVVVVGFIVLWFALGLLDRIAYSRGLPGAHPLSPAVAWTLAVWALLLCFATAVSVAHDTRTLDQVPSLRATKTIL